MNLLLAFGFGWVASSLYSQYWAKLKPAVGRALAVVFGRQSAPAPLAAPVENPARAVPTIGTALKNLASFFAMCVRNWKPIACVALAVFIVLAYQGCSRPFDLGKSKDELRLEAEIAMANAEVSELRRQRDIAIAYADRVNALRQEQINVLSAQGRNEIAEATPENEVPVDPELSAAWRNSLSRLCIYPGAECPSPDPA